MNYQSINENNCQYVKSLGNGEHLIYDRDTDTFEVWFNKKDCCSFGMKWNHTVLEYARNYENQRYQFNCRLHEFYLLEKLSHGSGINSKWYIEDKGNYFNCVNTFQCMNEMGCYDGYADFTLIIPKKNPMDFKLHFNGRHSHYNAFKYQLREYLEDSFAYDIQCVIEDLKFIGNRSEYEKGE